MYVEKRSRRFQKRKGSVLPLLAVSMVAVLGFVALAVDVGMISVARAQLQNVVDSAAMTGARTLDGSSTGNVGAATTMATTAATSNKVLNTALVTSGLTVTHGAWHYDTGTERFTPQYPPVPPDRFNLTRVEATQTRDTGFAKVFNISQFNVSTVAVAAHRPRDINIILDFSGSMNNESDLWNAESYLGSVDLSPNNLDAVFPRFGHYSAVSTARMQCTSSDSRVGKCNITQSALGVAPLVNDFYSHTRGDATSSAFAAAPNNYDLLPGGDNTLGISGSSTTPPGTYAKTVQERTGATNTQITNKTDAALTYPGTWYGYTTGPKYYGKTFFIWPPNPDTNNSTPRTSTKDWRRKFFKKTDGVTGVDDNTLLWDSSGNWKTPSGNYQIDYAAILTWLKTTGPNPFPNQLRAGRLLYYNTIPNDVPAAAYNHNTNNYQISWSDQNQRFWKEYIDYVLGVWRSPDGVIQTPEKPACSYGPDFTWGTVRISAPYGVYASGQQYRVHPQDNPKRPRHRMWFGPMTMIQFILDSGLTPGTAHDISLYHAKLGIAAALEDIKNNHPNDLVSLILFNRPKFNGEAAERGRFAKAQFSLSVDYDGMQDALWFPPNTSSSDVRPWDADGLQRPCSGADYQGNTCSDYGFMLAYNQFSENSSLRSAGTGGYGRHNAQRLVIFETDGMANVAANASFVKNGKQSYFQIGSGDSITVGSDAEASIYSVVDKICALETNNSTGPGFARPGRPVVIHCIGYGPVIEPSSVGGQRDAVVNLLKTISSKGGTYFPTSDSDTSNGDHSYKYIIGDAEQRRQKLETAFRRVTENVATPALIE